MITDANIKQAGIDLAGMSDPTRKAFAALCSDGGARGVLSTVKLAQYADIDMEQAEAAIVELMGIGVVDRACELSTVDFRPGCKIKPHYGALVRRSHELNAPAL